MLKSSSTSKKPFNYLLFIQRLSSFKLKSLEKIARANFAAIILIVYVTIKSIEKCTTEVRIQIGKCELCIFLLTYHPKICFEILNINGFCLLLKCGKTYHSTIFLGSMKICRWKKKRNERTFSSGMYISNVEKVSIIHHYCNFRSFYNDRS